MRDLGEQAVNSTIEPHLALIHAPADGNSQSGAGGSWRASAVALGVALLAAVGWLSTAGAPASTLRELPPAQRADVAERALGNLRDVCTARDHPRDFCEGQAQLLLDLPECGPECQALAREVLQAGMAVR